MHNIGMHAIEGDFARCWAAAGNHLNRQVDGGIQSWLRAHPRPPVREHLSFRMGNQLFFIHVVDVDERISGPGSPEGLWSLAVEAQGHACRLPMRRLAGGEWVADRPGWGLVDATSGRPVDPGLLVDDTPIELTDWELLDMAVQVVRDDLQEEGFQLMSWQSDTKVDPSLWFVGKSGGPEWVIVRAARYPGEAVRPANWETLAGHFAAQGATVGHFAGVGLASAEQPSTPDGHDPAILLRGHALVVSYEGLEPLPPVCLTGQARPS